MAPIDRLFFLIHGFCYETLTRGATPGGVDARFAPFLARERDCSRRWRSRLAGLSEGDGMAIIPFPGHREGPAAAFGAQAASMLGRRCFLLDAPDSSDPAFWAAGGGGHAPSPAGLMQAALVKQGAAWNKEELVTALHCLACCRQLAALLGERGLSFDPKSVTAEAWGASFDGCVTKYSLLLRHMLGLASPIGIDFDLTVPDAAFLLDAEQADCLILDNGLHLFIFRAGIGLAALYTFTSHSLADGVAEVRVRLDPAETVVKSKQGTRLWPEPETYALANVPAGYHEPHQQVVRAEGGGLCVPVSAGYVYRLAKAPAYIHAPPRMPYAEFRDALAAAERTLVT